MYGDFIKSSSDNIVEIVEFAPSETGGLYFFSVYLGTSFDNYKYQEGRLTFYSGLTFEGSFVDNSLKCGKETFPDGAVYEGELVDGYFHHGRLVLADG